MGLWPLSSPQGRYGPNWHPHALNKEPTEGRAVGMPPQPEVVKGRARQMWLCFTEGVHIQGHMAHSTKYTVMSWISLTPRGRVTVHSVWYQLSFLASLGHLLGQLVNLAEGSRVGSLRECWGWGRQGPERRLLRTENQETWEGGVGGVPWPGFCRISQTFLFYRRQVCYLLKDQNFISGPFEQALGSWVNHSSLP